MLWGVPSLPEPLFDRRLVRGRRRRALADPAFPDFLHRLAIEEIGYRLQAIARSFPLAAVFGAAPPVVREFLSRVAKLKRIVFVDEFSFEALDAVASVETLPFAPESLDAILLPLGLELANDLAGALVQMRRALKPDGLLLAVLLGGDTLSELRQSWYAAEAEVQGGVTPRVVPFADVRDLGGLLQRAGFALPVADVDRHTVRYADALALMRDLKAMGLSNPLAERSRAPVTATLLARAAEDYAARFSDADGRVRSTFELVTLTAWAPSDTQQKPLKPGSAASRLADALGTVERKLKQ